jgi:hypothetical protein
MTNSAIERASSLIQHWQRRFDFFRLYVASQIQPGTETCARWTAFLRTFEVRLAALRMRRDVLVGLEEAAQLDVLPTNANPADETRSSDLAELLRLHSPKASAGWAPRLRPTRPEL